MRVLIKLRRHNFSMLIEATTLSQTSTFQLTTHQHSGPMRIKEISHMEVKQSKVQDQCRIFNNSMLHMGSKDNSSKEVREQKVEDKGDLIPLKIRCRHSWEK